MEELDLKELFTMVWRKKLSIIVIIAISILIGYIYTTNYTTPLYKSTATIMLGKINLIATATTEQEISNENVSISSSDLTLNSNLIVTYSELIKSRSVMEAAKENLNYDISVDALISSVSVSRVNDSDLLAITASNIDPNVAKDIVTSVVSIFAEKIKTIYKIDNVYVIDTPVAASGPYNINHKKDILMSACIGALVAAAYVFLWIFIDNTVKNSDDIENIVKIKNLINIPYDKRKKEELIVEKDSKSIISEAFRTFRTNVQFSTIDTSGAQTLLVTSCLPNEGKSYVSANLASAFAQVGKKVILVDSDMRRGRQARIFNVPNKNGLSNYISNIDANGFEINGHVSDYIKKTGIKNLSVITAGSIPPNPAELLSSERLKELVEELKKKFDVIIFDGAPVLPITDSLLIGRVVVKTIIVAEQNKTKRDNLINAKNSIEHVGGKVIGVALNKVTIAGGDYSDNYYYYSSEDKPLTFKEKVKRLIKKFSMSIKDKFSKVAKKEKTVEPIKNENKMQEEISNKNEVSDKKEEKRIKNEEEKKIKAEEKVQKKSEKVHEEEIKKEEQEKEKAILEEKAKKELEEAKKAEELAKEAELKEQKEQEKIANKEKRKAEWNNKINHITGKALAKKDEISENFNAKKEERQIKNSERKAKKAEKRKMRVEEKVMKYAEIAKIREEERIKREQEKAKLAVKKATDSKITDEDLEENLYPKSKYNKF
jgi:capsular exopolysaccharide synthesis family protein